MLKIGTLLIGVALVQAGCDDDDDDDGGQIGGEVVPDAADLMATSFQVLLSPSEEVPACAAAGINATGAATVTVTGDRMLVDVGGLRYGELSSAATMAHIHFAPPGVAGPIVLDLSRNLSSPPTSNTFSPSSYPSPAPPGAPPDFATFVAEMRAGNTYINVHTALCPSGEIRGQIR